MTLAAILNDSSTNTHYYACRSGLGKTQEACEVIEHILTKDKSKSTLIYAATKRLELFEVILRVRRLLISSKAQHASYFMDKIFIKFSTDEESLTPELLEPLYSSTEYSTSEKDYIRDLISSNKIIPCIRSKKAKEELSKATVILTTQESLSPLLVLKGNLSKTVVLIDEVPEYFCSVLGETSYKASTLIADSLKRTKDALHSIGRIPNKKLRPLFESSLYTITVKEGVAVLHINPDHKCLKTIVMSASIDKLFLLNRIQPKPITLTEHKDNSKAVDKFLERTSMSYKYLGDMKNSEMQALLNTIEFSDDTLVINPASLSVLGGEQIKTNMTGSNVYADFTKVFVASQLNLSPEENHLLSGLLSDLDLMRYEGLRAGSMMSQSIYRSAVRKKNKQRVKVEFINSQAKARFENTLVSYTVLIK